MSFIQIAILRCILLSLAVGYILFVCLFNLYSHENVNSTQIHITLSLRQNVSTISGEKGCLSLVDLKSGNPG